MILFGTITVNRNYGNFDRNYEFTNYMCKFRNYELRISILLLVFKGILIFKI